MLDLKDSQVHTPIHGRKLVRTDLKMKKKKGAPAKTITGVLDIFTQGKEALEHGLYGGWKNRTGKLGADIFGCDAEFQRQQEAVVGDLGTDGGDGAPEGEEMVFVEPVESVESVEFDVEADLEVQNEI